jgi:hypothetical protein
MIATDAEQLAALAADYARQGYALFPQFAEPAVAAGWEAQHRRLPGNKVHVGYEKQTKWLEQTFSQASQALDGLAVADELVNLVAKVAGLDSLDAQRTLVWINRYAPGDHVPTHCDGKGSTQFLLCLQGLAEPEQGGELHIREQAIPLRTGDAVLFFARGVPHGTMPIRSPRLGPSGYSRVTCVMRFFATEGAIT